MQWQQNRCCYRDRLQKVAPDLNRLHKIKFKISKANMNMEMFTMMQMILDDASQVRARTSAGYGAFSRRFEFQTSPYREYIRDGRATMQSTIGARCSFVCLPHVSNLTSFSFGSNCHQRACSGFDNSGGHHVGAGSAGGCCWILAQRTVRHK